MCFPSGRTVPRAWDDMQPFVIATRKSPLARWQAEHVADWLQRQGHAAELLELSTRGDKILDQSLSKIGGKDLFVKEIEAALLDGRAHIAVHSLKDMPTEMPAGLEVAAYPKREDPADALVSPAGYRLDSLPQGATVGSCSLRRIAQLARKRPDLRFVDIRGNVQTRLARMKAEAMDATLLAYAGLKRLGLTALASEKLSPSDCLSAVGQGILGVQARSSDQATLEVLKALDDPETRAAAQAERAFLAVLQGGCQVPIAAHATLQGETLKLQGRVLSLDGQRLFEGERQGPAKEASELGRLLGQELLDQGADQLLAELMA